MALVDNMTALPSLLGSDFGSYENDMRVDADNRVDLFLDLLFDVFEFRDCVPVPGVPPGS